MFCNWKAFHHGWIQNAGNAFPIIKEKSALSNVFTWITCNMNIWCKDKIEIFAYVYKFSAYVENQIKYAPRVDFIILIIWSCFTIWYSLLKLIRKIHIKYVFEISTCLMNKYYKNLHSPFILKNRQKCIQFVNIILLLFHSYLSE